jgi:predicted dehydrogenase
VKPLRLGVLGAARISPTAVIAPAKTGIARLVSVAARDESRARKFAEEHGFEKILDSYEEVLKDPDIEAVYNPLPNGLHAVWNLRAIEAGKHVLSEKPSAANAGEAKEVLEAVSSSKVKFMEGFHYRYHPVMEKMLELIHTGNLGSIIHVEIEAGFNLDDPDDPRFDLELAGGSLMDIGCYAVHALRHIGHVIGGEPEVKTAVATERQGKPGVDEEFEATLRFPSGATARFVSSFAFKSPRFTLRVEGTEALAYSYNFLTGHEDDRIVVIRNGVAEVTYGGTTPSFEYQLQAFRDHIKKNSPIHTGPKDALAQAELLDALYQVAGLPIRPSVECD